MNHSKPKDANGEYHRYCSKPGCNKLHYARTLCRTHYYKSKRDGTYSTYRSQKDRRPATIVTQMIALIPLGLNAKDGYVIVNILDIWLQIFNWRKSATGYPVTWIGRRCYKLHQLIIEVPKDNVTDHADNNPHNNLRLNLRASTHAQNIWNQRKKKHNSSGYKGVSFNPQSAKYRASITYNWSGIHIGMFDTAVDAARAYNKKALELFGDFAWLNDV